MNPGSSRLLRRSQDVTCRRRPPFTRETLLKHPQIAYQPIFRETEHSLGTGDVVGHLQAAGPHTPKVSAYAVFAHEVPVAGKVIVAADRVV